MCSCAGGKRLKLGIQGNCPAFAIMAINERPGVVDLPSDPAKGRITIRGFA
jgi:hypothetical protein